MMQKDELVALRAEVTALKKEVEGLKDFIRGMYTMINEDEGYDDPPIGGSGFGRYNT